MGAPGKVAVRMVGMWWPLQCILVHCQTHAVQVMDRMQMTRDQHVPQSPACPSDGVWRRARMLNDSKYLADRHEQPVQLVR